LRRIRFRPSDPRHARLLLGAGALVFVLLLAGGKLLSRWYVLGLNTEPCLSQTLFLVSKGSQVERGDYIAFRFLIPDDRYHPYGQVFVKRVAGKPGDLLQVYGRNFWLDGSWIGQARERDSRGRLVGHFAWNGAVPNGKLFALGEGPQSYDSRYWGFVNETWVIGKAIPLV